MFIVDVILASIAARRKGIVTREDALAAGITIHQLDDRVRSGVLIPIHDGIYRHAAAPYTEELRRLAAVLACGRDAVLSHRSGADVHGYPGVRSVRPEVTTPHRDLPLVAGVTIHRAVRLLPFEVTVVNGLPVTSKGRTAVDYCAVTPFEKAQEVIAQAVIAKVLTPVQILSALDRSGGRGRPGTANLRLIASRLDELVGIESVLELEVDRILARAPIPRGVLQHELVCDDGRSVRLDRAWPEIKLAVEANGRRWHDTPRRKRETAARRCSIIDSGWTHLEFGWSAAFDTPAELRQQVVDEHRRLSASLAA